MVEQPFQTLTHVRIGEAIREQAEVDEDVEESLDALVFEAQRGGALPLNDAWMLDGVKRELSDRAVVADSLDVE